MFTNNMIDQLSHGLTVLLTAWVAADLSKPDDCRPTATANLMDTRGILWWVAWVMFNASKYLLKVKSEKASHIDKHKSCALKYGFISLHARYGTQEGEKCAHTKQTCRGQNKGRERNTRVRAVMGEQKEGESEIPNVIVANETN